MGCIDFIDIEGICFPLSQVSPWVPEASSQWDEGTRAVSGSSHAGYVALRSGGTQQMVDAYRQWKTDPATASVFTGAEVNRLGYQLLGGGQVAAATEIFKLNAESYPLSWTAYDSLAEAFMNAGENDKPIEFYEKSLEINPAKTNAVDMLKKFRAGGV